MRTISIDTVYRRLKDTTIITGADKQDLQTLAIMDHADNIDIWILRDPRGL